MSIKINVGGTVFETTEIILRKIIYFNDLLNDTNLSVNDILFVNRSAHIFKHILALAIDDTYKFPKKYLNELGFYGVTCDMKSIHDPLQHVENSIYNQAHEIKQLNNKINDLTNNIETLSEKIEELSDKNETLVDKVRSIDNSLNNNDEECCWDDCNEPQYFNKYCSEHIFTCDYVTGRGGYWNGKTFCEKWGKDFKDGHFRCDSHNNF